jgi:hypothetical protein
MLAMITIQSGYNSMSSSENWMLLIQEGYKAALFFQSDNKAVYIVSVSSSIYLCENTSRIFTNLIIWFDPLYHKKLTH